MSWENTQLMTSVNRLERALGDPDDVASWLNIQSVLSNDEQQQCSESDTQYLTAYGIHKLFIPASEGGDLHRFDEMMWLFRSIFRRDPAVAVSYGITTFMGAIPVWIFGSKAQKDKLAAIIQSGGSVSVAYHEKQNGNDLAASTLTATVKDDTLYLNGQKWIINNATVSHALTVFVKTGATQQQAKDFTCCIL